MSKKSCLITFLIVFVCLTLFVSSIIYSFGKLTDVVSPQNLAKETSNSTYTYISGNENSQNKILQVDVTGIILETRISQPPILDLLLDGTYAYGYEIKKDLVDSAKSDEIKAVILNINSPGGTITGAKAISDGVKRYSEVTGKPVYAFVSGLAASGGYWVASSAKEIIVDYGSLTGSIGVIMGPFKEYSKVIAESTEFGGSIATENGINTYYITAGANKDFDNPYKPMDEKVRESLQQGIDNEYQNFVKHVATNRNIKEETIKDSIGALVYENNQALALNLIDKISSYDEAVKYISSELGYSEEDVQIVTTTQPKTFLEELLQVAKLSNYSNFNAKSTTCTLCNRMLYLHGKPDF